MAVELAKRVAMPKRKKSTVLVGAGERCRKCRGQMERFGHGHLWKPKQTQPYYFRYWDKCRCGMLQHYEAAKVMLVDEPEPAELDDLTQRFKEQMARE